MKVTRFNEARPYVAPNHYEMCLLRLHGFEPGGPQAFWTGLSHFRTSCPAAARVPTARRWRRSAVPATPKRTRTATAKTCRRR